MDSHTSNQRGFCLFRVQKSELRVGCILILGRETFCYTQESQPLLSKDRKYFCPEMQFKISAATYKGLESFINSIYNNKEKEILG